MAIVDITSDVNKDPSRRSQQDLHIVPSLEDHR